ncbi:reverse transcriptase domain-containing protein [Tanacetum coccineum]
MDMYLRTSENTSLTNHASTLANPDPAISLAFIESNYKVLDSLLREWRRQTRNEDLCTELEYYSEEYDEEREMKPRPARDAPNRDGIRVERESKGRRHSERRVKDNENRGIFLPLIKARWRRLTIRSKQNRLPPTEPQLTTKRALTGSVKVLPGTTTKGGSKGSPYRGFNHGLLSNFSKSPREIIATDKVAKTFEQSPCMVGSKRLRDMSKYCHFHEDHRHDTNQCQELKLQIEEAIKSGQLAYLVKGIKKGNAKASDTQLDEWKKGVKDTIPVKAPILMINRESYVSKRKSVEDLVGDIGHITFQPITYPNNSFDPPSIGSLRVESKVPLVSFLREHSWPLGEVPLEITIGEGPFTWTEVLNFVIIRSNSPHHLLLGRTSMQKIGIIVSMIHKAIKFHTRNATDTIFSTYEPNKIEERHQKLKETILEVTKGILNYVDAEERIVVIEKHLEQIVVIEKQLPTNFKRKLLEKSGQVDKWAIELGEYDIEFRGHNSIKGHVLADFLVETPFVEGKDKEIKKCEIPNEESKSKDTWQLYTNGASSSNGSAVDMKVKDLSIFVDSQQVVNQVNGLFEARQPVIKQYLDKTKEVLESCNSYSMEHFRHDQNKKSDTLSKLASTTFSRLAKEVLDRYKLKASFRKYTKALAKFIRGHDQRNIPILFPKTRYTPILYLGIPSSSQWTSKSYKPGHRQRCGAKVGKESSRVVVVPIEISVETKRIKEFKARQNDKRRREDLDILEEQKETASIRKAHYKQKLERYYNKCVQPSTFKPGTYVLQLNSASKIEFQGKIGPTWEGPYVVRKTYGDGAYKLETLSGSLVD